MSDRFHQAIRTSLANSTLQSALDANAERRLSARTAALSSLDEPWHELRQQAHRVRAQTIARMDEYLTAFERKARANGVQVHHAKDGSQAVQIVLDIARQRNARLIAKSKTMVSEEIELNHALEAAGIRVVETDLGEYIIQLRGEKPAHIITPAVHLRRADVGKTFHEKISLPLTDDISVMTAAARRVLRQTFLEAEIGLSGVNFGVVETGTLCLVTNEGNGRMVTTLPPVHIALMGIERLVPTLRDLDLMLKLLPRSATGQKLTVYTSLINSPRQQYDEDGPLERHLILVDNGRRALRRSPLAESLLCIRCGACLNACPVFREIGGHAYVGKNGASSPYPGPIGSVISPGLFGEAEFGHLARASSLCGACREACPVDIDLPKLLLRVRAGLSQGESIRWHTRVPFPVRLGLSVYTWVAINPRRFYLAQKIIGLVSRLLLGKSEYLHLPAFTGWGFSKDIRRPALRTFRDMWNDRLRSREYTGQPVERKLTHPTAPILEDQIPPSDGVKSPVERFAAELETLGCSFTLCSGTELIEKILEVLNGSGERSILAWRDESMPPGLLTKLKERGIEVKHDFDPEIKVGLTGVLAAAANTGTLVLPSGVGKAQFVSLIPEIHLAIVRADQIKENLDQVFSLPEISEASCVSLISGPSRTADIEMTLTIGVHGPRQVHVFCYRE